MSSLIGNAMVFAGMDEHGFACFVDSGEPAKSFAIPAPVVQVAEDGARAMSVNAIKRGEYVKLSADTSSVWIRGIYDSSSRKFELTHADDTNRVRYVKTGTLLYVGFTY